MVVLSTLVLRARFQLVTFSVVPQQRVALHARLHRQGRKISGSCDWEDKILKEVDTLQDENAQQVSLSS